LEPCAATRFASPHGTAPAQSPCEEANPCSLFNAASVEATSTSLRAGDEIVLKPGRYSNPPHDLGPNNVVLLPENVTLHGEAGKPRPVISTSFPFDMGSLLEVRSGDLVSDLEIQSTLNSGIVVRGGVVDRVIVRGSQEVQSTCLLRGGTIRDSACLSSGNRARAVEATSVFAGVLRLRNVTAISSGTNSFGLRVRETSPVTLDGKGVIAEGTAKDVEAVGSGAASNSTISLENSDFDTSEALTENGGTASVTAPGTPTNIVAAPILGVDGIHELAGSPTIDRGATDGFSGTTDIDGQPRVALPAADIGADERAPAATAVSTTVSCQPAQLEVFDSSTCRATVENNPSGGTAPSGEVDFTSSAAGDFSENGACKLNDEGGGKASCDLTYTPTIIGSGVIGSPAHGITAFYAGDGEHGQGVESTEVRVSGRKTTTTLACAPSTPVFVADSVVCTATVANTNANANAATGKVNFSTDQPGAGGFSENGACTLADQGGGTASCHIAYTPTAVGSGTHAITARYAEDQSHEPSQDVHTLSVLQLHQTTTTLSCAPGALVLGAGSATCTATVSDSSAGPTSPSGTVALASDGQGTFGSGGACALAPAGTGKASCQVTYAPTALGSGAHRITASYRGDGSHQPSQGSAQLQVSAPPPRAAPSTTLKKKPKARSAVSPAKFTFGSDQAGATFQCKLDKGPFKPCRSPFKKKVKPGNHTFQVRAVNAAGLTDPTPVSFHWRVLPKP
jgi:hypothetical protein